MFRYSWFSLPLLLCPCFASAQTTRGSVGSSDDDSQQTTSSQTNLGSCAAVTTVPTGSAPTLGYAVGDIMSDSTCKTKQNVLDDLKAIDETLGSKFIRVYTTCGDGCDPSTPFIKSLFQALDSYEQSSGTAFSVVLGLWPDGGNYESQTSCLTSYLPTGSSGRKLAARQTDGTTDYSKYVHGITVGSEGLLRGTYDAGQVTQWVDDLQKLYPDQKIGTSDTWASLANSTTDALLKKSTLILGNDFPFWEDKSTMQKAYDALWLSQAQAFCYFKAHANPDAEIWIGESGWPSDGETEKGSIPSVPNENDYFQNGICSMVHHYKQRVFAFEAFDEPPKTSPNAVGGHFGMLDENRKTKDGVTPTCSGSYGAGKAKRSQITAAPSIHRAKAPLRPRERRHHGRW